MTDTKNSISNDLFLKLHQLQIDLIKNTSKQHIQDYHDYLFKLFESEKSINVIQSESSKLLEFLIFPVLTVLKRLESEKLEKSQYNSKWSDLNELLLKCCCLILDKIKLFNVNLFFEILNTCSILLSKNKFSASESNKSENRPVSEEFLCACFQLIQTLFKRSSKLKILDKFYKFNNLTTIGLFVSISLDILTDTNSLEVRLDALNTLKCLTNCKQLNYDNNLVIKQDLIGTFNYQNRISIIFASFLPGVSIKLVQKFLLSENLKLLNHKLICSSLELFGHVISIVFNDSLLDEQNYKLIFDQCTNEANAESKPLSNDVKALIVDRRQSKDWLVNSSDKIFILIERILEALLTHDNYNVKLSMVKFCSIVSNQCYLTLNKYLPKLLKIIVTFAANTDYSVNPDDNKLVLGDEASKAIDLLERKEIVQKSDQKYVALSRFSVIDSCIEEILLKLPRIMRTKTDSKNEINDEYRLSHFKTLYGYLKLIGDKGENKNEILLKDFFYTNLENLGQLLQALTSCISFDCKSLNNFYEIDNQDQFSNTSSRLSNYIGLKTYLDDKIVFDDLNLICSYLGKSDSARLIIDQLINSDLIYLETSHFKIEVMYLINLVLIGVAEQKQTSLSDEVSSIINMILYNFLNDFNPLTDDKLETVESIEKNAESSVTTKRNQSILQICLILESIRITSKYLSSNDYSVFLIDTLYFTLENYLSTNLLIRAVSNKCLHELAFNLGYKSIQELLSVNFDYIMNDLILKSNNQNRSYRYVNDSNDLNEKDLDKQSSHVFVLCALLEISNADLVPYLERLIDDYFYAIEVQANNFSLLFGVCRIMIHISKAMRRWYPIKFNFLDSSPIDKSDKLDDFLNLNLKMLAEAKKKKDYSKSLIETLREIDSSIKLVEDESSDNTGDVTDEEKESDVEDETGEGTQPKKLPLNVKLQTKCLQLCTHLISHPFKQIRLQTIDLIKELSKNLAEHTNEFLPLVHKLWYPICQRFSLDDLVVKSKIMFLLFDLSVLCGDFISSRFCKEFLPRLCSFMSEQAKISAKSSQSIGGSSQLSTGDPTYIYSHAFKLQCSILSNIDKMCVLFEIKEIELENVIESIILAYLDKRQPKKLQSLALQSIKNCSLIDSDVVWLSLHYVLPFQKIQTDEYFSKFKNLKYSSQVKQKQKYNFQLNNEILLNLVEIFDEI